MIDVIADSLIDSVRLLPFLFLTYLVMEYLEHKAGGKMQAAIRGAGKGGPLIGAVLGIFPQCGFSAGGRFYRGSLTNGQILETEGSIVIIGNVESALRSARDRDQKE